MTKKHLAYARVKSDTGERHTRTVRLKASTLLSVTVYFFPFFFSYDALHVICMTRCNTFSFFFLLLPQTRGLHV